MIIEEPINHRRRRRPSVEALPWRRTRARRSPSMTTTKLLRMYVIIASLASFLQFIYWIFFTFFFFEKDDVLTSKRLLFGGDFVFLVIGSLNCWCCHSLSGLMTSPLPHHGKGAILMLIWSFMEGLLDGSFWELYVCCRFISEIEAVFRLWMADGPNNLLVWRITFCLFFGNCLFFLIF